MKTLIANCIIFVMLFIGISSCNNETKNSVGQEPLNLTSADNDTNDSFIITDTIIYELVIKNPSKEDEWKDECLKHLDRKAYVDYLFKSIYNGTLIPYSEETNQPVSIESIKALEKDPEFSRDNIGMIQFYEKWEYNTTKNTFTKYVYAAILGYEATDGEGNIIGYKPVFRINFK
jgi:hypothetical protein